MANAPLVLHDFIFNTMCFPKNAYVAGSFDPATDLPSRMPVNYKFLKSFSAEGIPQNIPMSIVNSVPKTAIDTHGIEHELGSVYIYPIGKIEFYLDDPKRPDGTPLTASELARSTPIIETKKRPIIVVDMYDNMEDANGTYVDYTPRLGLDAFRVIGGDVKNHSVWEMSQYFDLYDNEISQANPRKEIDMIRKLFEYYSYKVPLIESVFKNAKLSIINIQLKEYLIRSQTEAFFTDRNASGGNGLDNNKGIINASLHYSIKYAENDSVRVKMNESVTP